MAAQLVKFSFRFIFGVSLTFFSATSAFGMGFTKPEIIQSLNNAVKNLPYLLSLEEEVEKADEETEEEEEEEKEEEENSEDEASTKKANSSEVNSKDKTTQVTNAAFNSDPNFKNEVPNEPITQEESDTQKNSPAEQDTLNEIDRAQDFIRKGDPDTQNHKTKQNSSNSTVAMSQTNQKTFRERGGANKSGGSSSEANDHFGGNNDESTSSNSSSRSHNKSDSFSEDTGNRTDKPNNIIDRPIPTAAIENPVAASAGASRGSLGPIAVQNLNNSYHRSTRGDSSSAPNAASLRESPAVERPVVIVNQGNPEAFGSSENRQPIASNIDSPPEDWKQYGMDDWVKRCQGAEDWYDCLGRLSSASFSGVTNPVTGELAEYSESAKRAIFESAGDYNSSDISFYEKLMEAAAQNDVESTPEEMKAALDSIRSIFEKEESIQENKTEESLDISETSDRTFTETLLPLVREAVASAYRQTLEFAARMEADSPIQEISTPANEEATAEEENFQKPELSMEDSLALFDAMTPQKRQQVCDDLFMCVNSILDAKAEELRGPKEDSKVAALNPISFADAFGQGARLKTSSDLDRPSFAPTGSGTEDAEAIRLR